MALPRLASSAATPKPCPPPLTRLNVHGLAAATASASAASAIFRRLQAEQKSAQSFLLVAETDEPGKWDFEKSTVQRACTEVFDDMDLEDLVVSCFKSQSCAMACGEGGCGSQGGVTSGGGGERCPLMICPFCARSALVVWP